MKLDVSYTGIYVYLIAFTCLICGLETVYRMTRHATHRLMTDSQFTTHKLVELQFATRKLLGSQFRIQKLAPQVAYSQLAG